MTAVDPFAGQPRNLGDPALGSFAITPSNDDELPKVVRRIRVETAGDLRVQYIDGSEDTIPLADQDEWSGRIKKVFATGTTITGRITGII